MGLAGSGCGCCAGGLRSRPGGVGKRHRLGRSSHKARRIVALAYWPTGLGATGFQGLRNTSLFGLTAPSVRHPG